MEACTFFGHAECYGLRTEVLMQEIEALIGEGVDTFYVGNHGGFDRKVRACLSRLSARYPKIRYFVVLAYLPTKIAEENTMFPEGLELGPPKFAIERRNKWMIASSTYCLCYVEHTWGGAYKFARMAKKKGLRVHNLGAAVL